MGNFGDSECEEGSGQVVCRVSAVSMEMSLHTSQKQILDVVLKPQLQKVSVLATLEPPTF